MRTAYLVNGVRTPFGRYGGALSSVRTDDLAAHALRELMARNASVPAEAIDDVILGNVNQAGEDNRNVARMAVLLAGLPTSISGATVNRLCGSGLEALTQASRQIMTGEAEVIVAGGVEGMSRAPFVMSKATEAFSRNAEIYDTTIGWRFINPADPEAVRHRVDAGDGRERGAGFPGQPRRPGRLRHAQPGARLEGAEERPARQGDRRR